MIEGKNPCDMTDKEVAEIIKVARAEVEWEYPMEYAAAFDRAIEVLEQESCEDAISRQVAIDAIKKIHPVDTEYDCTLYDKVDVMYVLKDLPSVPPKQKTGHWIKYGIPRCGEQHYKCSLCGYYINFGKWGEFYTKEFKYCPNCGCRMIES